jgi:hypothetical protein
MSCSLSRPNVTLEGQVDETKHTAPKICTRATIGVFYGSMFILWRNHASFEVNLKLASSILIATRLCSLPRAPRSMAQFEDTMLKDTDQQALNEIPLHELRLLGEESVVEITEVKLTINNLQMGMHHRFEIPCVMILSLLALVADPITTLADIDGSVTKLQFLSTNRERPADGLAYLACSSIEFDDCRSILS